MKKRSLLLLALAAITAMPFASCGDDSESSSAHEHTYATTWSADADNHWYGATCEHTDQKANVAPHTDEDNDGACDVCEYDGGHEHTYATTWSGDATGHWYAVTCGHDVAVKGKADHVDENNDGACDVCDWDGDHMHTYATEWSKDATKHWYAATCDHSVKANEADHVDENDDGVCDVCTWYDETHTHTYATEWSKDATNHWYAATCDHSGAITKIAHVDENDDGVCDTCAWYDEAHTHTFATTWSINDTQHWYAATCDHSGVKSSAADHVDENNDRVCDVCSYDYGHTHEYATEWSKDETKHWYAATCGHNVKKDEANHVDENNDGDCDVCFYESCEHEYNTVWSANDVAHWHAATCGHDVKKDEANHFDYDKDNLCDTCSWTITPNHTHEYATEWSIAEEYHYHATTCGHTAVSLRQTEAHVDDNEDGLCDECNALMDFVGFIDTITSTESSAKVNGGNIKYTGLKWNDDYTDRIQADPVDLPFLYGVNYTMSTSESYGTYYYVPYTVGETNKVLTVQVSEGEVVGVQSSEDTSVLTQGYYFQLCNWCIEEYGVENLVYEFYSLKDESFVYGFDLTYDATTMAYTINLLYYENESSNVYEISATFKTTDDVITELDMTIKTLGEGTYTLNDTDKTYTLTEEAANSLAVYYEVTQTVGARSEDASPYQVEDYILSQDDLAFTYGETTVVNGSSITVGVTDWENKALLSLSETAGAKYLAFTDGLSYEIADYSVADIGFAWGTSDFYIQGKAAGTTTITVSSDFGSITFNVTVNWAEITSFAASAETEMYAGLSTEVSAIVNTGANPAFTAEVTTAPTGAVASVVDGVFTADIAGEYVITLTSVQDTTITATVTITVNEAPDVSAILNGKYTWAFPYDSSMTMEITFTPASEGATSGTAVINAMVQTGYDRNTYQAIMEQQSEEATYAYEAGSLVFTHVSGSYIVGFTYDVVLENFVLQCGYYGNYSEMQKEGSTGGGSAVDYANELWDTTWYDASSQTYLIFDSASTGVIADAADPNSATWLIIFDFTVDSEGVITVSNSSNVVGTAPFSLNSDAGKVNADITEVNIAYTHPMNQQSVCFIFAPVA